MPTCIFKPVPDVGDDHYVEWSTVVDAPIGFGGADCYRRERVERARRVGASWTNVGDASFWGSAHTVAVFNIVSNPPFPFGTVEHADVYELAKAVDEGDVDCILSFITEIAD